MGTYKVRNEIETKQNETKRNEINENETKRNETKRNQQKAQPSEFSINGTTEQQHGD
jgi:hypothetical protein